MQIRYAMQLLHILKIDDTCLFKCMTVSRGKNTKNSKFPCLKSNLSPDLKDKVAFSRGRGWAFSFIQAYMKR